MKKAHLTVLFALVVGGMNAQEKQSLISIWPDRVPGAVKAKSNPVVDTAKESGVVRYTEVTNPTLAVFKPTVLKQEAAVIVCPGGGYGILAYDKEGTEIAQWLAKQGFTAYVLAYRVPNQREGALQDLQRAIRLVRQRHKVIKEVGVIGFSAGGSLSARAATRFNQTTYPKVDATDEWSCRPDFALLIYPAYLDEGANKTVTPELTITEQTPPMFLFATSDDFFANSSLVMAQALREHKIPVELHVMAKGGHGYGMRSGAGLQWPVWAEAWLKERMKK